MVGSGVDLAMGPRDPDLVDEMLAAGGGIVAEVPPGTPSSSRTLVARDRIQSGLSRATVVVQTDLASGTMHTARFTIEQGRLLAVVAPPPTAPSSAPPLGRPDVWSGNTALTTASGCDPAVLHAKGRLAALVALRRPLADVVLPPDGGLDALWAALGV